MKALWRTWIDAANSRPRLGLAAILILAFAIRSVLAFSVSGGLADPDNYLPLATSIAEGRGFSIDGKPTAYRPPLYPLLLAPVALWTPRHRDFAILAAHVVLGVGTVALTMATCRRWGLSRLRSLSAGMLAACDPVLAIQVRSVMTETLAAFLTAVALFAFSRPGPRNLPLGGLAIGVAGLCRPSLLPAGALLVVFELIAGDGGRRERLHKATVLALFVAAPLLPWSARNWAAIGEPVATTTHGGYTLALANNREYYDEIVNGPPGRVWSGAGQRSWQVRITEQTRGMSEPAADRFLRDEAIRLAVDEPLTFLKATVARLGRFWGVSPSGEVYSRSLRFSTALWTFPFWIALFFGAIAPESRRYPRVSAIIFILSLTLVHSLYWTDLRMRAPIVPAAAALAACARIPIEFRGPFGKNRKTVKIPTASSRDFR